MPVPRLGDGRNDLKEAPESARGLQVLSRTNANEQWTPSALLRDVLQNRAVGPP
jgi:hypothetical protein